MRTQIAVGQELGKFPEHRNTRGGEERAQMDGKTVGAAEETEANTADEGPEREVGEGTAAENMDRNIQRGKRRIRVENVR